MRSATSASYCARSLDKATTRDVACETMDRLGSPLGILDKLRLRSVSPSLMYPIKVPIAVFTRMKSDTISAFTIPETWGTGL